MKELKKLKLSNKSLEEFDELMNYHLDKIEELEIEEININPKLYNLISLCTNLNKLVIKGDLRVDVNKIIFNICKPENIKTLILESVKLPTNKVISKFINLSTISLNNINFSNLSSFFDSLSNPEKIIALNLTNVDFGKKPISICSKFENLKYFNLDNLKNCIFDSFEFIYDNKKLSRFEFSNNEIGFENINTLTKGNYNKNIDVSIKTNKNCDIINSLEIKDREISITINTCDLEKIIDNVSLYKLTNLFIVLGNETEIGKYIKKFKKVKEKVTIAINDIAYFSVEDAQKFQERLNVDFVNILEAPNSLKITDKIQSYSVEDYIKIREEFDKINEAVSNCSTELDKFNELYNYFKNKIKYVDEETDVKTVLIDKKSSYNYYSLIINSCLKSLGFASKVIRGSVGEDNNLLWNQVKINDEWYNFDIGYELRAKTNKKFLQYAFKSHLLNDDQFYKTHSPSLESKPEVCYVEFQELKKEVKKEENKVGFFKRFYQKIMSIFKFNKEKALPEPNEDKKGGC